MKQFILSAGRKITRIVKAGGRRYKKMVDRSGAADATVPRGGGEKKSAPQGIQTVASEKPQYRISAEPRTAEKEWSLDSFPVTPEAGKSRFHDYEIPLEVMRAISDLKFHYCTPIQEKALPGVLAGNDLVGKANTGTGKTAVFLVTIFSRLISAKWSGKGNVRALVLAPTRELVVQIAEDAKGLAKYCNLSVRAVYGGVDYQKQMEQLNNRRADLVVATPGRLLDFIGKGVVNLSSCNILVLDEADRMLDMGFIPDVRRIVGRLPGKKERQTMLFSATVPEDVRRLSSQWCVQPQMVEAEPDQVAVETVKQIVYLTTVEEKYAVLYNLIRQNLDDRIIVFANMKNEAKRLANRLQRNDIDCVLLSGDVAQNKRMTRLESFRSGRVKVLVATDVAGRGIHIEGITFVVNYTLPYEPEDYVHRIGRTGRAGASGKAVSFACEEGSFYLPAIEDFIGRKFDCVLPEESLLRTPPKGRDKVPAGRPGAPRPKKRRRPRKRGRRQPGANSEK